MRSCTAVLASLTTVLAGASSALANGTGGVSAQSPSTKSAGGSAATSAPAGASPVTAKTPKLNYRGPVYEKTATGEVVPYASTSATAAQAPAQTEAGVATGGAAASTTTTTTAAGEPSEEGAPELLVPGSLARYVNGLAAAPESAPPAVQEIIWAGNHLIGLPYIYGGGHNPTFTSPGYDCSGTVSYALHGADLLSMPLDSGEFESWGAAGEGRWVTIFTNAGHAYMTVAGLRLDTSAADDPSNEQGPRWRPLRQSNTGFVVRHPAGL